MDKIELMENILSQYRNIQKVIKESEQDKKRGELLLNKEEERYDEAKSEFGEHPLDEYQSQVLKEYDTNVKNYKEKLDRIDETVKKLNEKKDFMATDRNIQDITQGLMEIDRKIKQKELELRKSNLALDEYYMKDDKEGKIPQDFYNEQDKIKKEINGLTSKKEKFEKFLDELKIGRDNLIKDGRYLEANREQEKTQTVEKEPIDIEAIPPIEKEPVEPENGTANAETVEKEPIDIEAIPPIEKEPVEPEKNPIQPEKEPIKPEPRMGPTNAAGKTPITLPKQLTYKVLIGKTARIRFDGKQYYVNKKSIKEGINLTYAEVGKILEKTGFDKEDILKLNDLIKEGTIDSTVVNVIYNSRLEDDQKQDIMGRYIKDCYESVVNSQKTEGKVYYDRENLSKTSIIDSILKREVTQEEKMNILERAEKAARYGIGRLEGEYKPDIRSRLVNFITKQHTQKQLTSGQIQKVAETYNDLREKNEAGKIYQKDFKDEVKLNKAQLDEIKELHESQQRQEMSKSRQQTQNTTRQGNDGQR